MRLTAVHQPRVDAERDVVQEEPLARAADVDAPLGAAVERLQRSDRIVTVEPEIPGEMVAGPERDADERGVALERNAGDRRERPIASGDAQDLSARGPRELRSVLPFLQDMGLDVAGLRLGRELLGSRRARAGPWVDEEEGRQGRPD